MWRLLFTRTTPGPVGLYVVSVGYLAGGIPGAVAGWAAMVTPALLIIPLVHYLGRRAENRRAKGVLQAVVLSSAGLLWAAAVPIGKAAITDKASIFILLGSLAVLATRKVESVWSLSARRLSNLQRQPSGIVSSL